MKRVDHSQACSFDGARSNQAEDYFSRLRRAEIGIHHHIAGAYLLRYAQESSWWVALDDLAEGIDGRVDADFDAWEARGPVAGHGPVEQDTVSEKGRDSPRGGGR
jgi:ISXO2-like transposase domain